MIKNIVIIGMNYEYNIEIAQALSNSTDLYFLDANEYINYQLQNKKNMEDICGIDYLQKQEDKVIKNCAQFENTIITVPVNYLLRNNQYNYFDSSIFVYIRFSKEKLIKMSKDSDVSPFFVTDIITFEEKDAELFKIANYTIDVKNKKQTTVENEMQKFLEEFCEHK